MIFIALVDGAADARHGRQLVQYSVSLMRVITSAATVLVALVLIGLGISAYNAAARSGGNIDVGRLWNYRPPGGPTPTPTATVAPGVNVSGVTSRPSSLLPSVTPPPAATLAPPTSVPSVPSPASTAAVSVAAAATAQPLDLPAECLWASPTLEWDEQLDYAAAQNYPKWRDYYLTSADQWTLLASWLRAQCVPTWPVWQCELARGWVASAIAAHNNGNTDTGATAAWNATWTANYQRIDALLTALC